MTTVTCYSSPLTMSVPAASNCCFNNNIPTCLDQKHVPYTITSYASILFWHWRKSKNMSMSVSTLDLRRKSSCCYAMGRRVLFCPSFGAIITDLKGPHMWSLHVVTYSSCSWKHASMACVLALLLEPSQWVHTAALMMSWQTRFSNILHLVPHWQTCYPTWSYMLNYLFILSLWHLLSHIGSMLGQTCFCHKILIFYSILGRLMS